MKNDTHFEVEACIDNRLERIAVSHSDETFDIQRNHQPFSIINNGDNSWSLVRGKVSQLTVNQVGQAIEDFYQRRSP